MARNGLPNRCPVCRAALAAPPAAVHGERDCPRCGAGLWFLLFSDGPTFFVRRPGESVHDLIADLAGPRLGLTSVQVKDMLQGADSLDVVELVMEIEDALRQELQRR
jgi:hypothetical protein